MEPISGTVIVAVAKVMISSYIGRVCFKKAFNFTSKRMDTILDKREGNKVRS